MSKPEWPNLPEIQQSEWIEEEALITLNFQEPFNMGGSIQIKDLDSSRPLVEVGQTLWQGHPNTSLTTRLFFDEDGFIGASDRVIELSRLVPTPKPK